VAEGYIVTTTQKGIWGRKERLPSVLEFWMILTYSEWLELSGKKWELLGHEASEGV
jgi:hypothetical protein